MALKQDSYNIASLLSSGEKFFRKPTRWKIAAKCSKWLFKRFGARVHFFGFFWIFFSDLFFSNRSD
jgi:hypothetical protein